MSQPESFKAGEEQAAAPELRDIRERKIEKVRYQALVTIALCVIVFAAITLLSSGGYGSRGNSSSLEWIMLPVLLIGYWAAKLRYRCPWCKTHPSWTTMMSGRCMSCWKPLLPELEQLEVATLEIYTESAITAMKAHWNKQAAKARRFAIAALAGMILGFALPIACVTIFLAPSAASSRNHLMGIVAICTFIILFATGIVCYLLASRNCPTCPFCGQLPTLKAMPLIPPRRCICCGAGLRE